MSQSVADARRHVGRGLPLLACVLTLWSTAGCSTPEARIDRVAADAHLDREIAEGVQFRHVLYRTRRSASPGGTLHVYIEGDGSAYRDRLHVASDPTPRQPLMLQIMSRDEAAALYLGRPCYFGLAGERGCDPQYWTTRRFSPEVVASLAEVLRREIQRTQVSHVTLLGHSGGATLGLLLAEEIPQVDRVITLAGNLDPTAWTRLHGYAPLTGSLDPTQQIAVRDNLIAIHYAGGADRNIPPALIQAAAVRIGGSVIVVPGFTHTCCWTRIAPEILSVAN